LAPVKEIKNNAVAFKFLEEGEQVPVGSAWIPFHMIFDVKCDLTRKARYVAGGKWTQPTSSIAYSSVVTRESIRIAFLIAALNDLEILSADIGNAYLQAPAREQVRIRIRTLKARPNRHYRSSNVWPKNRAVQPGTLSSVKAYPSRSRHLV
jgi:hypothetical protein